MTTWAGSHSFGPFLQCDLPLELMLEGHPANFVMRTRTYVHANGYRQLLGLPSPPLVEYGRVRRLNFFVDYSQSAHKVARYRELRRRIRESVSAAYPGVCGAYLLRGAAGEPRVVENEFEIVQHLRRLGFVIVEPDRLSAHEVSEQLLDVPIVVGVEGSHLSHAIFSLKAGGSLVVLQPPDRFAMPYKEFTDAMEMRFAFLVGKRSSSGSRFDIDEIDRILDLLA